jgi:hypothetical protein
MTVSAIDSESREKFQDYRQKLSSDLAAKAAARVTQQNREAVARSEQTVAHQRQTDHTRPRYLDVTV